MEHRLVELEDGTHVRPLQLAQLKVALRLAVDVLGLPPLDR
jgi:hypothetical protein